MNNIPYKFHFQFSAPIWKTEFDPNSQILGVEIRNSKEHWVQFNSLDISNFSWKLQGFSFEQERWWSGITSVTADGIIIHVYENEDNPDLKSFFKIGFNGEIEGNVQDIENETNGNDSVNVPIFYDVENEHFKEFQEFVVSELNVHPQLGCDYLEYNDYIILSYYVRSSNGFDCFLLVVDPGGEIRSVDLLEKQLTGQIGKPYFIVGDNLFFIKNKSEICVYDLS